MHSSILTASEDKVIKVWDKSTGSVSMQIRSLNNQPFYSVDTNGGIIVGGTNEDILFYDVRNTKVPLEVLDESHNEDVTCVKFHPNDPQKVISCGTD